jgi:hypothetical protein
MSFIEPLSANFNPSLTAADVLSLGSNLAFFLAIDLLS